MTVDPQAGKPTLELNGRVFYFCSPRCRDTFEAAPEGYIEATDPVCGISVERATAQHVVKYADQRFYFCSASCQEKFEGDPSRHLDG